MPSRIANVTLRRDFRAGALAQPPDLVTLDQADDDGDLDGNHAFMDLSRMSWDDVRETLVVERRLIARLEAAEDLDDEAEAIGEELLSEFGSDALWFLDPGVAAATIAISALGGVPVASCNGGVLGGHHKEPYPLVAFYLAAGLALTVLRLAEATGAGLIIDGEGRGQLYGRSYRELVTFAEFAIQSAGR